MDTENKEETYRFAAVATDMAIFTIRSGKLMVLLIQMNKRPFVGMWALPGGLINPEESIDSAARRILLEKTGIEDVRLDQLGAFGDIDRDPFGRVVSVAYIALIPSEKVVLRTTGEYSDIAWAPVDTIFKLAYDHNDIVREAVRALQQKLITSTIAFSLLPTTFTLTELQMLYEIILKKSLDKRNFRKKIVSLEVVETTGKKRVGGLHRPALLYRFIAHKPQMIHML